jgi:hypothetical protein
MKKCDIPVARRVRSDDIESIDSLSVYDIGSWAVFTSGIAIICSSYSKADKLASSLNRCI